MTTLTNLITVIVFFYLLFRGTKATWQDAKRFMKGREKHDRYIRADNHDSDEPATDTETH